MAKAKEGRDAPETECPNPNRRTAMMITVGAAAISVASALPASASGSYAPSQGYLDCVAAWKREMVQGLGDDEGDRVMRENCKSSIVSLVMTVPSPSSGSARSRSSGALTGGRTTIRSATVLRASNLSAPFGRPSRN